MFDSGIQGIHRPGEHPIRDAGDARDGRPVTAAVDGSAFAQAATLWAAGEALRRATVLRLATVIRSDAGFALLGQTSIDPRWDTELQDATELLAQTEASVRPEHPDLPVERCVLVGAVLRELRDIAGRSSVLVVGARARGGHGGLPHGSLCLRLAGAAPCPLVVVPRLHAAAENAGPTVVGMDEHERIAALRFALADAGRRGGGLKVVRAWSPYPAHSSAEYVSDTDALALNAAEQMAGWLKDAHAQEFDVHPHIAVQRGRPAEVLVEESREAALLVVGAHRHHVPLTGGVGPLLHRLLSDSYCPVAVVPDR